MVEILIFKKGATTIKLNPTTKFKCPGNFNIPLWEREEHGRYTT
jgi:hypothetical protein